MSHSITKETILWTSRRLSRSRLRGGHTVTASILAGVLAVAGCSDVTEPSGPGPVVLSRSFNPWPDLTWLGTTGTAVPDTLVVQAQDTAFAPVEGVVVEWAVTPGGGSVEPLQVATDADGKARAVWTLGDEPGEHAVEARSPTVTDTVRFEAIVTPPPLDDWTSVLDVELTVDPAQLAPGTATPVTATLALTNRWTGVLRLETFNTCIAIVRIHDAEGGEAFTFPWGCWATIGYHTIPPGETLETSWSDQVALEAGDYTARAHLHIFAVNGHALTLADPEQALTAQ